MYFEKSHSYTEDEFYFKIYRNQTFPIHIHRSFEYFMQLSGSTEITIENLTYTLMPGDAVLIFPFQSHSYKVLRAGENNLCIFAPDLAPDFHTKSNLIPASNFFRPENLNIHEPENRFLKRAFVYSVCGQFEKDREYKKIDSKGDNNVFSSLLLYVNENFRGPCKLSEAASKIKYDYAYISKLFKRKAGITFNQYVNLLRVREVQRLLLSSQKSIDEIAFDCGFSNVRTFNRKFTEITKTTPTSYRKAFH